MIEEPKCGLPASNAVAYKSFRLFDLRLSEIAWLAAINCLLFESAIQNATGFTYIDEIALAALLVSLIGRKCVEHSVRHERGIRAQHVMVGTVLILLIGICSNLISGVVSNPVPIIIDIIACVKFPLALVCSVLLFRHSSRLFAVFEHEAKFIVIVLLAFGIINLFVPVSDFGVDPRYGLRASFRFVFGHPESLNIVVVGLLVLFAVHYERNLAWIVLSLIVMSFSLRSKAFGFIAVSILLLATWEKSGRIRLWHVALAFTAAAAFGWDQYQFYFQLDGSARNELTKVGFEIASSYFPFGSGFATYGSNITAELQYYSPLYYRYGLYMVDGLVPGSVSFLSDVFWPIVIGQFGYVGTVSFVALLVMLIGFAYTRSKSRGQRLSCVLCFAYLLIGSTSGSSFFHPSAIYLAVCLGIALSVDLTGEDACAMDNRRGLSGV